jgi:hypothetical protein
VGGGGRGAVADLGDRRPDGPGDVDPGAFGFRAEAPGPAAETGGGGELADQEVFLGAETAGPLGVVPLLGFGEVLVEGGEALPLSVPGLLIDYVVGWRSGHVVQVVGQCYRAGRAGGGGELDQFQGGQVPAALADEQVQVAQAQAVRHPRDGVREADEPEIVIAAQREAAGLAGAAGPVEDGKQLGHAAVGGDGPRLGERGRRGGVVVLPQQLRVLVQGVREHGPGTEPPVAAGGHAVVPVRRRGVTVQDGQAAANVGPIATLLYGFSVLYCMTTSLAEGGEGLGTLGLPEPVLCDLAAKAGFAQVRHVEMDNPFNSLYELAR